MVLRIRDSGGRLLLPGGGQAAPRLHSPLTFHPHLVLLQNAKDLDETAAVKLQDELQETR